MSAPGLTLGALLSAVFDLSRPGHYLHWGFIQISTANFVVIVSMAVVFLAAILLPFPHRGRRP